MAPNLRKSLRLENSAKCGEARAEPASRMITSLVPAGWLGFVRYPGSRSTTLGMPGPPALFLTVAGRGSKSVGGVSLAG